jgi:hypothetical protein
MSGVHDISFVLVKFLASALFAEQLPNQLSPA